MKQDFKEELGLSDDEATLYYRLFDEEHHRETSRSKRKVHFVEDQPLSSSHFTFGQFQSMFHSSRQSQSNGLHLEIKATISADEFSQLGSYLFSFWFSSTDVDNFRSYLQLIQLKDDDLVLLCLHSSLSRPSSLPKSIGIWKRLFSIIASISGNKSLLSSALERTSNALTALLLALIFRREKQSIDFTLLARRLSGLVAIRNLSLTMETKQEEDRLTVETIFVQHRYDYLLELLTRRMIEAAIDPLWLSTTNDSNEHPFQAQLSVCRQILPHTFEPTVLLIYSSWICMSMWNKQLLAATTTSSNTSRTVNELFESSLLFYNQISIGIVKQNLGTLLWHTYLRSRIVTLTQLIEKIGKIPKDRLCYKEIRLNESDLIRFLEQLSKNFFNTFIESIYNNLSEVPIFNVDDVWRSEPRVETRSPSGTIIHLSSSG